VVDHEAEFDFAIQVANFVTAQAIVPEINTSHGSRQLQIILGQVLILLLFNA